MNNTMENEAASPSGRSAELALPNSRVQLKPALVDKEFYSIFRSRGSVRVQPNKIRSGNKRTDCLLDLFLDTTEINS